MTDDRFTRLRETGAGRPALVLHGGPGPGGIDPLVEHLARTHRVLAPVHPGWDGTARAPELNSVPLLAAHYRRLLERCGIGSVLIVGTSFGGWVAAELAAQLAEHNSQVSTDRLILIDSVGADIPVHAPQAPQAPPALPDTAPRRGPSPAAMAALAAYTPAGLTDPMLLPRLAAHPPRTLLIWGEHDTVVSTAYGRAFADGLPGSTLVTIADAGHVPYREAPDAVRSAIDRFLAER